MPGEPLWRLIERTGLSVRQLCARAGVPENRLGYWLKPGTVLTRMPTMVQIHEIAQVLGCRSAEVYRAFRAMVDGELALHDDELPEDERTLLAAYRRLGARDRHRALQIVTLLCAE